MKDVQAQKDVRGVKIDKVGIADLYWPILIKDKGGDSQKTSAKVSLVVNLSAKYRGTHMSRLVELMSYFDKTPLSRKSLERFLLKTQKKTESADAFVKLSFPYYRKKKSPVVGREGFMSYMCQAFSFIKRGKLVTKLRVRVSVLSLCPCSKAISKTGAHNQRSRVEVSIIPVNNEWFGELIDLVERCGSADLYSVLKRPDEKWIMDKAMAKPRFVEDIVRDVAIELKKKGIKSFIVRCKNYESIHNHNAFAQVSRNIKEILNE